MQIIAYYDLFENCMLHNRRQVHIRNRNYFEVTIPQYSLSDFHAHFRMKPASMERLVNIIRQHMDEKEYYVIPLQKQVALTVWILAKAESFLAVGLTWLLVQHTTVMQT
ncbi:PREDICTED: uncharacterized protein LOC108775770 [Cyphomyrmex costatus]|uniref:uncharacterized protein LOC108775770 n=1 Tax=Cyphomyrmex costatus TaxID=456900 RepID=UPI00085244E9|nr:PREDICTED: uncharacterized protein LOC108775770 [Cyphomyrmex costatus]